MRGVGFAGPPPDGAKEEERQRRLPPAALSPSLAPASGGPRVCVHSSHPHAPRMHGTLPDPSNGTGWWAAWSGAGSPRAPEKWRALLRSDRRRARGPGDCAPGTPQAGHALAACALEAGDVLVAHLFVKKRGRHARPRPVGRAAGGLCVVSPPGLRSLPASLLPAGQGEGLWPRPSGRLSEEWAAPSPWRWSDPRDRSGQRAGRQPASRKGEAIAASNLSPLPLTLTSLPLSPPLSLPPHSRPTRPSASSGSWPRSRSRTGPSPSGSGSAPTTRSGTTPSAGTGGAPSWACEERMGSEFSVVVVW